MRQTILLAFLLVPLGSFAVPSATACVLQFTGSCTDVEFCIDCGSGSGGGSAPPSSVEYRTACLPHNPDAYTNACVVLWTNQTTAWVPTTVWNWVRVCPISYVCTFVPVPGLGPSQPAYLPWADAAGYVEATEACSLRIPCRVALP